MNGKRINVNWLVWTVGSVLVLMFSLLLFAVHYIDSDQAQTKIHTVVTEKLGSSVQFQRVSLSLFFRPHLVFHQVSIAVPELAAGSIQSANVYFQLWPLLTGSFRIAKFSAVAPDFTLELPKEPEQAPEEQEQVTLTEVKKDIASILTSIRSISPDLVIEINKGRLVLRKDDRDAYIARNIRGHAALTTNGFEIEMSGDADRLGPSSVHGRFVVDGDRIAARDVKVTVLDSSLRSSIEISSSVKKLRLADISLDGIIGFKTVQWASKAFNLPPEQTVQAPLTLSNTHLIWKAKPDLTLTGRLSIYNGPSISFQVHWNPGELLIPRLIIEDEESIASITVKYSKKILDFTFNGSLNERTLNNMFERNSFHRGWIRGDLRAHVQLDHLQKSSATGVIEGSQFIFSLGMKVPVKVDHVVLHAENKTAIINTGIFYWGNTRFDMKGAVKASADGLHVDMDLSSDDIKVENIQQALASYEREETEDQDNLAEYPQVLGVIRFNASNIIYGRYAASSVMADITLDQELVHVAIHEAEICGISLAGTLTKADQEFQLDFKPGSAQQLLEPALACLWGTNTTRITGIFDLHAYFRSQGKREAIVHALQGWVTFTAKKGEIYQYPLLTRIFSVINISDMMLGKFPDLSKEGFAYNSITIKGSILDGKLILREAAIDGVTANLAGQGEIDFTDNKINITVLVAPFKTVDLIVKYFPLVNNVLANTLITIPVKVKGDLGDPTVTILSPTAIGEGVLGIMKRTLQLSFRVIQPIIPGEKKHEH